MPWPTPEFKKAQVNRAGEILASEAAPSAEVSWAETVLANWRACHGYPINTFQATLRTKLSHLGWDDAIVAQRLKRTPAILNKLRRFNTMQLARMQDIGGLRAVVSSLGKVRRLESEYENARFEHTLVSRKDYIAEPKTDGYRSVHLIFRYKNKIAPAYDGLLLELQIRTKLQHAWATAVETMGTFLGQALKSQQGEQRWLKFFEIAGAAFAHLERSPLVPGYETLDRYDTFVQVARAENELRVLERLRGFSIAVGAITSERGRGTYHLVILDSQRRTVQILPFPKTALEQATEQYAVAESRAKAGEPLDVVLVSAGPIGLLRRAYPNYFLDTNGFIRRIEKIIGDVDGRTVNQRIQPTREGGKAKGAGNGARG